MSNLMDPELQKRLAQCAAANDQTMAELWDRIKSCYSAAPNQMDYLRASLFEETVAEVASEHNGPIQAYRAFQLNMITVGLMALQDRLAEWMAAGEIPPGTAE